MKKVILVMCLTLAALSVKAYPINWTATVIPSPGTDPIITISGQMYVELYLLSNPLSTTSLEGAPAIEGTWGLGGTLIKGGLASIGSGAGRIYGGVSGNVGFEAWSQASVDAYRVTQSGINKDYASTYMKVYYNKAGGLTGPSGYTYSGVSHVFTHNIGAYNDSIVTMPFSKMSTTGGGIQWTAVPEPTTMALFGLGGLAMMLRRKMRKEA